MGAETKIAKLNRLNKALNVKNAELEETLRVIQSGEVDALVVNGPLGERIFTLQSVEQPYRELVEAMNEGALTVSPEGIILYCNVRFVAMTRVPHEKLVGSEFKRHVRLESQKTLAALLQQSRSTPAVSEISLRITEQISLPVQLSVSAIELVGTEGYCIIATDLSAQKQNTILFQQQEWLGTLLNLLPVPLVLLDSDLQGFTFINAKATEVLEGAIVNGATPASLPMPLAFENEQGNLVEIRDLLVEIDGDETSQGIETILATRLRKIPVLLFSEPLPAMHGRAPSRLLMFQDISTIKQAQLDLSLAVRGRDQFMASLSHELRTPMNVILGWVQILRQHPSDEAVVKSALDTLDRNAELQRDLIENLLDVSRIITGSLVLQTKSLDLKVSVGECLTSLQLRAEEKGIEFVVDVMPETAIILADDKRIQQLISNLVQNAIKFTHANGKIVVTVRTDQKNKTASLSVQDNGHGIDLTFLPYVFDQFKQENMTTNRTFGGLGLGLAICKTIVEQHKGKIKATSAGLGKGATFVVQLPLAGQSEIVILKSPPILNVSDFKGLRILLVDDAPDNLLLFTFWLKKTGAEIKTLDSAVGVIEAMDTFRPHILLSDISMPNEDGYALIAKVRALSPERGGGIPAAALTAHARPEDRDLILAAGFNVHIAKPVTSNGLLEAVGYLSELNGAKVH
ncbi:MAG: ATP-binding protein [Bdellovibrionota bacterium]